MKVEITLNVKCEALWDVVVSSFLYEYNQNMNTDLSLAELTEGLSYKKEMKSKLGSVKPVEVFVREVRHPHIFSFEIFSGTTTDTCTYHFSDEKEQTTLCYEESHVSTSTSQDLNYSILSALYGISGKRRMKAMFRRMEQYILEQEASVNASSVI